MISPRQMLRQLRYDFDGICDTYQLLSDAYSREMLLKIATYRVTRADRHLPERFREQYSYVRDDVVIRMEPGDFVIDGGAFTGGTAMRFARDVGENGKVYAFECLPRLVEKFRLNVQQFPELDKRIVLIAKALWKDSTNSLYVVDRDAATRVTFHRSRRKHSQKIESAAIDELVAGGTVEKIDFLKLDIEGAEPSCLMGARESIRRFRPKLAVCLYHQFEHFVSIPKLLHQFVPEYRFYLDHHRRDQSETVLYATCP